MKIVGVEYSDFSCPRCGFSKTVDLGPTIQCDNKNCGLEFEKEDLYLIEDNTSILSIQEKKGVLDPLMNNSTLNEGL